MAKARVDLNALKIMTKIEVNGIAKIAPASNAP